MESEAIRGNQRQSEAIRGNNGPAVEGGLPVERSASLGSLDARERRRERHLRSLPGERQEGDLILHFGLKLPQL